MKYAQRDEKLLKRPLAYKPECKRPFGIPGGLGEKLLLKCHGFVCVYWICLVMNVVQRRDFVKTAMNFEIVGYWELFKS
jgi:hypothetical protein